MGPAYFIVAILGCADGAVDCTPVATEPTHYATEAECGAATESALLRNNDFDYPTIVARCRAEGAPLNASAPAERKPKQLVRRS